MSEDKCREMMQEFLMGWRLYGDLPAELTEAIGEVWRGSLNRVFGLKAHFGEQVWQEILKLDRRSVGNEKVQFEGTVSGQQIWLSYYFGGVGTDDGILCLGSVNGLTISPVDAGKMGRMFDNVWNIQKAIDGLGDSLHHLQVQRDTEARKNADEKKALEPLKHLLKS